MSIRDNARPKPNKSELQAAAGKTVPDVIAPGLRVLFCGINPGLYSGAVGHHFARPGNRFWQTLYAAGFTSRRLSPYEERTLLQAGFGITNIVARSTASAKELQDEELRAGAQSLQVKVRRFKPQYVAVLGIEAYRKGFGHPDAVLGLQSEPIGNSIVWVLPNPSGLNAHYQLKDLARIYRKLRERAEHSGQPGD